jgi:hypothetical protein
VEIKERRKQKQKKTGNAVHMNWVEITVHVNGDFIPDLFLSYSFFLFQFNSLYFFSQFISFFNLIFYLIFQD